MDWAIADGSTPITTVYYALAERDGKWAALLTAANQKDAQIGGRFLSEWFDTREEAVVKMSDVCEYMSGQGLEVLPMRPPN